MADLIRLPIRTLLRRDRGFFCFPFFSGMVPYFCISWQEVLMLDKKCRDLSLWVKKSIILEYQDC